MSPCLTSSGTSVRAGEGGGKRAFASASAAFEAAQDGLFVSPDILGRLECKTASACLFEASERPKSGSSPLTVSERRHSEKAHESGQGHHGLRRTSPVPFAAADLALGASAPHEEAMDDSTRACPARSEGEALGGRTVQAEGLVCHAPSTAAGNEEREVRMRTEIFGWW